MSSFTAHKNEFPQNHHSHAPLYHHPPPHKTKYIYMVSIWYWYMVYGNGSVYTPHSLKNLFPGCFVCGWGLRFSMSERTGEVREAPLSRWRYSFSGTQLQSTHCSKAACLHATLMPALPTICFGLVGNTFLVVFWGLQAVEIPRRTRAQV